MSDLTRILRKIRKKPDPHKYEMPPPRGYDDESEAREAICQVIDHTMAPYTRLVPLYQQAKHCELTGVKGAFVECGTWKGGCVGLMALAALRYGGGTRTLHLFDSFEGIPEPNRTVDGEAALKFAQDYGGGTEGRLVPLQDTYKGVGTMEVNQSLLRGLEYPTQSTHFHKGWFQDTLPKAAPSIGDIAILRLDGDWYSSTRVCLEHLYAHVSPGGFVIIDDYGCYDGCKKAVDEFRDEQGVTSFLHTLDSEGRYWIVQP